MDIVDKVLWDSSYDTRQEAVDEIERLRQQNAELLAALKDMSGAGYAIVSIYRAAIAKTTGGE